MNQVFEQINWNTNFLSRLTPTIRKLVAFKENKITHEYICFCLCHTDFYAIYVRKKG